MFTKEDEAADAGSLAYLCELSGQTPEFFKEFSRPAERTVLIWKLQEQQRNGLTPSVKRFIEISASEWGKYRNVGAKFVAKICRRGWAKPKDWRKIRRDEKARRLEKLNLAKMNCAQLEAKIKLHRQRMNNAKNALRALKRKAPFNLSRK